MVRDYVFMASSRAAARAVASYGVPVYLYRFNATLSDPAYDLLG